MIKAILVDNETNTFQSLERSLNAHRPQIDICCQAFSYPEAIEKIEQISPSLLFIAAELPQTSCFKILDTSSKFNFETILIANSAKLAFQAVKYQVSGFVLKPLDTDELISAIKIAENKIRIKRKIIEDQRLLAELKAQPPSDLLPVPTIEGFDFIPIDDIIRCEGYQSCTRIITKDKSDILSSYHIGVFAKKLEGRGFFSPHKSHLINSGQVKKYYKEGTILMSDNSCVPVSKRRKSLFLNLMLCSR